MKFVGFRKSDFTAKDGTQVKGVNVYLEEPVDGNGKGLATEKVYLSDAKIEKMNINIDSLMGKDVRLSYNRWGKVDSITVLSK